MPPIPSARATRKPAAKMNDAMDLSFHLNFVDDVTYVLRLRRRAATIITPIPRMVIEASTRPEMKVVSMLEAELSALTGVGWGV